jgi:hypothetical protein
MKGNYRKNSELLKQGQQSRVDDAEIMLRYFMKRDEMNAETHNEGHGNGATVRYSPITIAANRVLNWLYSDLYEDVPISFLYYPISGGNDLGT